MRWDEVQPAMPAGWAWSTLVQVADTQLGKMLSAKSRQGDAPRPYLRNQNVQWGRFVLDDLARMDFSDAEAEKFALRDGDVVTCEGGEIGRSAVWHHSGRGEECFYQKALHRVRARPGVLPEFIALAMRYMAEFDLLDDFASGSTIRHLPQEDLRRLPLPLPPTEEQRRIVDEVERRFSHIDVAERGLRTAEGRLAVAASAVLGAAVDGRLVPSEGEWAWSAIGEIAEVQGGIQKQPTRRPRDNKFSFLRVANVKRSSLELDEIHEVELFEGELARYRLVSGDLLVVEGNGSADQVGRAAVWDGSIPDCVHQNHLIRVRPSPDVLPAWLGYAWNAPQVAQSIRAVASSTSGLHTLSTAKVKAVRIPVPPLAEQEVLVKEVERRLSLIRSAVAATQLSRARTAVVRRAVLRDAFAGRLAAQDDADEPAELLLKRLDAQPGSPPQQTRRRLAPTATETSA